MFFIFLIMLMVGCGKTNETDDQRFLKTIVYNNGRVGEKNTGEAKKYSAWIEGNELKVSDGVNTYAHKEYEYSDDGYVLVSFYDELKGFLLYCSDPGCGMMTKILYETDDGGKTLSEKKDLSGKVEGYPKDIFFDDEKTGYVTVSYHGGEYFVYCLIDGECIGLKPESIPDGCRYIDGNRFYREDEKTLLECTAVYEDYEEEITYLIVGKNVKLYA